MGDVINKITYYTIIQCLQDLKDEVYNNYYRRGRGNPGSPKRVLQRYGFRIRRKDKLITAVEQYLTLVEVI